MAKPEPLVHEIVFPPETVLMDADAFDAFVRSQGIELVHYKGIRCPFGLAQTTDTRRTHSHQGGCSNGFLYTEAGTVTARFGGNKLHVELVDLGLLDGSKAMVTLPRYYDDTTERIRVAPYDRFFLKAEKVLVTTWELVESHVTGRDRLDYPVVEVEMLIDSRTTKYVCGNEFVIDHDGQIEWKSGEGPGTEENSDQGRVYAIRYLYRPFWYVESLMHEIRLARTHDIITGTMDTEQMPMAMLLQREYVFRNESEEDSDFNPRTSRSVKKPADGGFGAR